MLEEGDEAPDFTLATDVGDQVSLKQFRGQPVVLYFYPKDDTPGCTKEACAFRDDHAAFEEVGAAVLGVSKDSVKSHAKFRDKYDLNFPLLSDEDGEVCEAFGVLKEKSMFGNTFLGIQRATFLIDGDGTIARVWPKVKVGGHSQEVLDALRWLSDA